MSVPEIERLSMEKVNMYMEYVKENIDLLTSVDVNEHADYDGFTKIKVTFQMLKRIKHDQCH